VTRMEECGTLRFDIAAKIVEELRRYTDTPPDRENTIHILDGAEQMVAELKQIETDLHRTARRKTNGRKPIATALNEWQKRYEVIFENMQVAQGLFREYRSDIDRLYQVVHGIRRLMDIMGGIDDRLRFIAEGLDKRLIKKGKKK
jgi:hypothetical protein